jgi:uncharacterized protein (TIGR02246 family)
MSARNAKETHEAQIRQLVNEWTEALRNKDVDMLVSRYARDISFFGIAPPLHLKGADSYRKNLEGWVLSFKGPIGYEVRDLKVTAGDDVAFCQSLNHLTGTRTNGEETDSWLRVTVCFQKINGEWMVTHEHVSVPFYMDSGKAAIDLKP